MAEKKSRAARRTKEQIDLLTELVDVKRANGLKVAEAVEVVSNEKGDHFTVANYNSWKQSRRSESSSPRTRQASSMSLLDQMKALRGQIQGEIDKLKAEIQDRQEQIKELEKDLK